jgi:hypothetical protein
MAQIMDWAPVRSRIHCQRFIHLPADYIEFPPETKRPIPLNQLHSQNRPFRGRGEAAKFFIAV